MKIKILTFLSCSLFFFASAQTIKVNEDKFVSIVFDSNIIQGTVGNNDFSFSFNEDGTENIALLKANKKTTKNTNLIVKTINGTLYNINVEYGTEDKNIIKFNESDGININGKITNAITVPTNDNPNNVKNSVRENDYTIGSRVINDAENKPINCTYCDNILKVGKYIKRVNSNNYDIKLDLENVCYFDSKIYISINISNNSNIDYNINYIKSYVRQSKESKSSNQYLEKNPVEIYNTSRVIKGGADKKMIFIYDQFTIDDNKALVFELNEANGERNQTLFIPNYIINKPIKLK
ncbi:DUF4138 domain-containing protein [Flavobacterium psychrophilum]|uniref:DUF4138 domain-containing protein n=1 Tax=Flavobacterium psychrophilum TaxID=96345 RepID=UPI00106A346A|nr:DUF4138 domain-containing protein [Flavobacterium psychrophilum]